MDFNDLTLEQKAKARACTTPEELVQLAKNEGYDLTSHQVDAVLCGSWSEDACMKYVCPDYD